MWQALGRKEIQDLGGSRLKAGGIWKTRRRWEDNIKMDVNDGWTSLNSSGQGCGQLPGSCEHGNELSRHIKCGNFLERPIKYWLPKNYTI